MENYRFISKAFYCVVIILNPFMSVLLSVGKIIAFNPGGFKGHHIK